MELPKSDLTMAMEFLYGGNITKYPDDDIIGILTSLKEKLSSVEKEFSEKLRLFQLDKHHDIQEKLLAVQKKYEIQKKNELQDEIKRFKANEISRIRLEEREKYETEVKKIRHEYDHEYNLKSQALRAMEKEMMERLQRLQEVRESEAYSERQKFLQEMTSFKAREADLNKKIELQERSQKIEEERLANEVSKLKILENALKEKGNFQEERYKNEIESFKRDYQNQFTRRQQDLLHRESILKVDTSKLEAEKNKYLECQDNLAECKERNVQLEASLGTSKLLLESMKKEKTIMEDKLAAMNDYETLKQTEIILKKDIEHLTQRLVETNTHCKEQEQRHQSLVKELTDKAGKPKEVLALRKEVKDIKEKYKFKEKSLNEARKSLEHRLHVEVQRANHFQALYEDQLTSQNLMENEIEHLKTIQQQTEQLLSLELRHQKVNNTYVSSKSLEKDDLAGSGSRQPSDHGLSSRNFDNGDSSGMDESSLASLAEGKKIFQKLEREAEALDASYRDFQNRIRKPQSHTLCSLPSSMTFRRLQSYYSNNSPEKRNRSKATWVSSTAPPGGFYPLQPYDGSGISGHLKRSEMGMETLLKPTPRSSQAGANLTTLEFSEAPNEKIESGRLPSEENVGLTIKDLKNDTSVSEKQPVHGEHSSQRNSYFNARSNRPPEHRFNNIVANGEHASVGTASEPLFKPTVTGAVAAYDKKISKSDLTRDELKQENIYEISVDTMSMNSSQRAESEMSGILHDVEGTTLDSMWEMQQQHGSTSLDMEELEKRRQEDDERRQSVENTGTASGSEKSLSGEAVHPEDLQSDNVEIPAEHGEDGRRGDLEVTNATDKEEANIDPVMLKYMEMIKQRRESEAKQQEDEHSDNLVENDDNDVSVGKLSDEDFNWE